MTEAVEWLDEKDLGQEDLAVDSEELSWGWGLVYLLANAIAYILVRLIQ